MINELYNLSNIAFGVLNVHVNIENNLTSLGRGRLILNKNASTIFLAIRVGSNSSLWIHFFLNSKDKSFNGPKAMFERLYNSLINQTYKNWNWFILDDSTNPYTSEMINNYHDPRITVFKNCSNKSLVKSLTELFPSRIYFFKHKW